MKRQIFSLFLLLLTLVACGDKPLDPNKPVYVKIKTTMGDVTVLLYDDTPLHRDNFIKLCQSNEYEGMLFHRVIKEFVVQGGDPESKAHEPGALYGDGDGGYTVPAEILPNHFNKKGALIDAKEIDAVNPERASAGTQFCFVQGKVLDDKELAEKGGALIGVNTFTLDGDEAAISEAKDVLTEKGVTYQNVYFDSDGEAGKFTSNIFAYPTTYVVDRNGNIVGEPIVGAVTEKKQAETLQKLIDQALAADQG